MTHRNRFVWELDDLVLVEPPTRAKKINRDAHSDWMDECVPELMGYGKDQLVAVAACMNMWRDAWEESHPDGADDPGPSRPGNDKYGDKQLQNARKLLARGTWNEAEHPRVPAGGPDGGQFGPGGGGASSKPGKGKKVKKEDFDKAKITITGDKARQDAVIAKWNETVGEDPAVFKQNFMGGLDGHMNIQAYGITGKFSVNGEILDHGQSVGTFTRDIDIDNKSAYSAFFQLKKSQTGSDVGKKMLAGNIETYQQLGIEKVSVTANIDVGGYAWAKYGYVPTQEAWETLRNKLEQKLTGGPSGGNRTDSSMQADEWSQLSEDVQEQVRFEWRADTHAEFLANEQQNWRDSGEAKSTAKTRLAEDFTNYQVTDAGVPEWVGEALDGARNYREERGLPPIPYTNQQLYDAIELTYNPSNHDGEEDPDVGFDEKMLQEPIGYDPAQLTLPGVEPIDPASFLTKDMRRRIETRIIAGFDAKAEADASEMDPPDYLSEQVDEYQDEYWDQKDDSEKLEVAVRFDLANIEFEPDEDEEEEPQMALEPSVDPLLAAVRSSDPKSIWKVADSAKGKELLLGSGWSGVLNLKDAESMARFKAYVGKAK